MVRPKRESKERERAGARGQSAAAMVAAHKAKKEKKKINRPINPSLMMAKRNQLYKKMPLKRKSKKKFDSARSRRGSSFVDDYNMVDTLFFDGDEETKSVNSDDKFYVDGMDDSDEEEEDSKTQESSNYKVPG